MRGGPGAAHAADAGPGGAFRHVLVCLDGSATAETVLPLAAHLAGVDGARMTLLRVLEAPPQADAIHAGDVLEWDIAREEAQAYLEPLRQRAAELGIDAASRLAEGTAPRRVDAVAEEIGADLLVFSTEGRGDGWRLGGTARKILALARCPALVVPAGEDVPEPRVPLRRILVPLDGSARGEHVLPVAVRLARADQAEILLVHVVSPPVRTALLGSDEDLALAQDLADRIALRAEAYLAEMASQLRAGGVRTRQSVVSRPDHRQGIVTLAAAEDADLILLSAHGAVCNPRRRFGTTAAHVIEHSAVPVLVLQDIPRPSDAARTKPASVPPSRPPPRSVDASAGGS